MAETIDRRDPTRQPRPREVTGRHYHQLSMSTERVVIVGGGILGTMHALEATTHGWVVTHLEADAGPRRASVRNFGLIWVSGRAGGPELDLALRARVLWEQIAERTPDIGFRPDGSLTVATGDAELALMAEAAARPDAPARGTELLDVTGVRKVNPAIKGDIVGGLWCPRDAVVEPGSVLGSLRRTLEATGRYRWLPGHQAVDVQPGGGDRNTDTGSGATVIDHLGLRHRGSLVVLCIGDRLSGLGNRIGVALAEAPLRRCRLQMMQTAPISERLSTAIADADSMRYYPAFDLPARAGLPTARPETSEWGMQLLLVQRAGGEFTIGDTHVYQEPFDFAVDESLYDLLHARAESILGWGLPPPIRRWAGVYTLATDGRICFRERIDDAIWVVTGPAGRGMTLSPAIAEQTWEEVTG
jgi:FAD dependent oxidoreductase TIGR03364